MRQTIMKECEGSSNEEGEDEEMEEMEDAGEEIDPDATISDVDNEESDHGEERKETHNIEMEDFSFDIGTLINELLEEQAGERLQRRNPANELQEIQDLLSTIIPGSNSHQM
ncbi:hypothetical protein AA313_de0206283 [Arthrobotrys entomopaga]|nr:hypothetical protein AA313_de0206283 [Arthrobotrys entomopaga]